MSTTQPFDKAVSHRFHAAECFNRTWELIEKPGRSSDEDEQMRSLCHASLWHWTQRDDCTARNLSIAYWQLSRVYALMGRADDAARYGEICLHHSKDEGAFYLGYAHEALARAAMIAGDAGRMVSHLNEARRLAAQAPDLEERAVLEKDLENIQCGGARHQP